jgi:hypothetical protein
VVLRGVAVLALTPQVATGALPCYCANPIVGPRVCGRGGAAVPVRARRCAAMLLRSSRGGSLGAWPWGSGCYAGARPICRCGCVAVLLRSPHSGGWGQLRLGSEVRLPAFGLGCRPLPPHWRLGSQQLYLPAARC